jgi:glycosyltransferase involved in cell wall biosynthesis
MMIKVVHLSTSSKGGAGGAAYRIHNILLESGVNSTFLVKDKDKKNTDKSVIGYQQKDNFFKRKINRLISILISIFLNSKYLFLGISDKPSLKKKKWLKKNIPNDTSLVLVHWVAGFITLNDLKDVLNLKNTKVSIVMMDMAMLTGGCHFSFGCEKYKTQCFICPATNSSFISNRISHKFFENSIAIKDLRASILSWTHFGLQQSRESAVPFSEYLFVPPPINQDVFTFKDRPFKDSEDSKVILMGSYYKKDQRKGYLTFVLALNELSSYLQLNKKYLTILVPNEGDFSELNIPNIKVSNYNFAHTEKELAGIYQQADLFVSTSIDDTGPLMVIESLFCGVPVIATKTGVAEELLTENSFAGKVVNILNHVELANAIHGCFYGPDPIYSSKKIENTIKHYFSNSLPYDKAVSQLCIGTD